MRTYSDHTDSDVSHVECLDVENGMGAKWLLFSSRVFGSELITRSPFSTSRDMHAYGIDQKTQKTGRQECGKTVRHHLHIHDNHIAHEQNIIHSTQHTAATDSEAGIRDQITRTRQTARAFMWISMSIRLEAPQKAHRPQRGKGRCKLAGCRPAGP
eukprot:6187436-Pleurochrysis_carterae.AAC.8